MTDKSKLDKRGTMIGIPNPDGTARPQKTLEPGYWKNGQKLTCPLNSKKQCESEPASSGWQ